MTLPLTVLIAATLMAGLSWFISVVHYPLFALVGEDGWLAYHQAHTFRTTFVVLPPMVVELVGSGLVVLDRPDGVGSTAAFAGLALAAATWGVTFGLSVPDHDRLSRGWDPAVGRRLVVGHHVRTALWSAHVVLSALIVAATG